LQTGELASGVHAVRVFGADEAAGLARTIAACPQWDAATINADLAVDRAVRDADVLDEIGQRELIRRCRERLYTATRGIAAQAVPFASLGEAQIVRYVPGGKFIDHRDSPAKGASPRVLSIVCYFNDDFSGGATVFPERSLTVSPERGLALVFVPELLHRGEAVTAGTKYVMTAWYLTPQEPREG